MNRDFHDALQRQQVAFLWIDHQSDFGDYDDVHFERYSGRLANLTEVVDDHYQPPGITVLFVSDTIRSDANGVHHDWYDNATMLIKSHAALDDFLLQEDTDILHPVDAGTPFCLKHHPSCFEETRLAPFLRNRGFTHLLLAGGYLDACVKASAESGLNEEFAVGILHDVTYGSPYLNQFYKAADYPDYIRDKFADTVMITDTTQVLTALQTLTV